MKTFIENALTFAGNLFAKAPALKAWVLNLAVLAAARFGFHLTSVELVGLMASVMAVVHALAGLGGIQAKANAADAAKHSVVKPAEHSAL